MKTKTETPAVKRPESADLMHAVCACQVDATPRLALCGTDCSDEDEGIGQANDMCYVCWELLPYSRGACGRCR